MNKYLIKLEGTVGLIKASGQIYKEGTVGLIKGAEIE